MKNGEVQGGNIVCLVLFINYHLNY